MDFWNCRVRKGIFNQRKSRRSSFLYSECFGTHPCRTAVLEPGQHLFLPLYSKQSLIQDSFEKVDDDGESYWVFESRDVSDLCDRVPHNISPITPFCCAAFTTCESRRLEVRALPHVSFMCALHYDLTHAVLSSRMFWVSTARAQLNYSYSHLVAHQHAIQIALYVFPVLWVGLLIISIIKLNLS
jgi:hypothetical protein